MKDASALKNEVKRLMLDSNLRSQMRMAADAILESNKGSLKTTELGIVKAINRN